MQHVRRAALVAAIGAPCPYCGLPMQHPQEGPRSPSRDHIRPRSKGYQLPGNRLIVCYPCNAAKGSRSLASFLFRLIRAGDPRAPFVGAVIRAKIGTGEHQHCPFLPTCF
jgi:hypothetical protein